MPWMKLDGEIPFYSEGEGWQRQKHIYESPFYYIDYCLAQTVSLQFWAMLQKDRANAWEHYMAYTRQGGSRVFTELLKNAGLDSPFEESCLRGVCETAKQWLDNYDLTGDRIMQQKKTRRGREYLNDFRRDVNGSYLYQGSYRRYTGSMPYAKLRGLLWTLCGGALAALAAAGMVPAPGAMQQFYVLLPYAGALVAGISAVWALARMSRGGARLRSYVYEETVAKLPLRCLLTGVFAALAAVGECMDVFLNGGQEAIRYAVLFAALAAAAAAAAFAAGHTIRAAVYTEESGSGREE